MPSDIPAIRVFLVDAHEARIRVVGEAESVDQARRRVLAVLPDVAIVAGAQLCADLGLVLPGLTGARRSPPDCSPSPATTASGDRLSVPG